jgi:hypothetical protein
MSGLFSVPIDLRVSMSNIETLQILTDMYFKGVLEGKATIAITASGACLLFTDPKDVTYVELDNAIINEYCQSVTALQRQLSAVSFTSQDHALNGYFHNGTGIATTSLSNATIAPGSWSNNSSGTA